MELQIIAYAHNGFNQKFGIPRQCRENSLLETRIVFTPDFRSPEAIRGIEGYSHLWLIWGFHQAQGQSRTWTPTVRPPRLGGNRRMGVFATRSPFRPNHIGLSAVQLIRIEDTSNLGKVLIVRGADMLNNTPIYDIKPYLTFSDCHPDAKNGFAGDTKDYELPVTIDSELLRQLIAQHCPWLQIREILSQDPRPAYHNDPKRIYHLDYDNWCVDFSVRNATVCVEKIYLK